MTPVTCEAPPRKARRTEIATVLDARRRSLRVNVGTGLITSGAAGIQPDAAVMDVNHDGFRLATTEAVPVNSEFLCALMPDVGARRQPRARVLYCRFQKPDGHDGGYVSQLEFVDGPDAA